MNPLYQQMRQNDDFMQNFPQFMNWFHGDARNQVQQLLNSGRVSQKQYDWAVQMTNQRYEQAMKMIDQFRHMVGR